MKFLKTMTSAEKAFTFVEIIVSSLILALILLGLANIFIASQRHALRSRSLMAAGELGRYYLERLYLDVRQDTWTNSPVNNRPPNGNLIGQNANYRSTNIPREFLGGPPNPPDYSSYTVLDWLEEPELNGIKYYPVYEVSGVGGVRRVKLILCWNEPSL